MLFWGLLHENRDMSQYVDLNDGHRMPTIGLGTFQGGDYESKVSATVGCRLLLWRPRAVRCQRGPGRGGPLHCMRVSRPRPWLTPCRQADTGLTLLWIISSNRRLQISPVQSIGTALPASRPIEKWWRWTVFIQRYAVSLHNASVVTIKQHNSAPYRKGGHRETCFIVRVEAQYKLICCREYYMSCASVVCV